jgi:hypothetical protein
MSKFRVLPSALSAYRFPGGEQQTPLFRPKVVPFKPYLHRVRKAALREPIGAELECHLKASFATSLLSEGAFCS